jgi:hypothetical protein
MPAAPLDFARFILSKKVMDLGGAAVGVSQGLARRPYFFDVSPLPR